MFQRRLSLRSLLLLPFLALWFLSGCFSRYQQIQEVSTADRSLRTEDALVFENDTLRIRYHFWADKGVLSYEVFNKSSQPLYIDWKKSSFIINDNKLDYWQDDIQIYQTGQYHQYLKYNYSGTSSLGVSFQQIDIKKQERITFIPPQSKYYRYQFSISPTPVPNIQDSASYTAANSPLSFRNYLTYSFSEQFGTAFTVDNSFYVSKFVNQRFDKNSPASAKKLYVTYLVRTGNTPKAPAHLLSVSMANGIGIFPNNVLQGASYEYIDRDGHNGFLAGFDRTTAGGDLITFNGNTLFEEIQTFSWNNFYLGYKRYFFREKPRPLMPFAGVNIGNVYTYYSQTHHEITNSVKITTNDYLINKRYLLYLGGQAGIQYTTWRRITAQAGVMAGGGLRFSTFIENKGTGENIARMLDVRAFGQLYASVGIRL